LAPTTTLLLLWVLGVFLAACFRLTGCCDHGLWLLSLCALLRLLLGDLREGWAVLAFWCAVPKYALVLAALAYVGVGGLVSMVRKVAAA